MGITTKSDEEPFLITVYKGLRCTYVNNNFKNNIMALNPILNVYKIELNPKTSEPETFEAFVKSKYPDEQSSTSLFSLLCKDILSGLGDKEFKKDLKAKKVVGIQKTTGKNESIKFHSDKYILEGILEGGKYNILRQFADIDDKSKRGEVKPNQAVLDKYYFLMYMPLNSHKGLLMIQSYTEETIQSTLLTTLRPLFSDNGFYNLKTEVFVPKRLIDDYKNNSSVKLFKYSSLVGIGSSLRNSTDININTFEVVIELKPLERIPANSEDIDPVVSELNEMIFDKEKLEEYDKKVFIEDKNKRKANFELEKQLKTIRPTIYLEDHGVSIDPSTGQPSFEDVKNFCFGLLEECKNEININTDIDEF
jgi:hypothetical protein